ncbi:hypothetical protein PRK78_006566 [Emydomyces testavorans]|uniref:Uncharacterized protein n=1 Tax=Emydomyces testavorans TaxID=2070801 RepID=A0AAF0ILT4_9EURO|nr:hypothetical protein PRK78_006566 [Emydomyces testavorans]
MVGYKHTTVLRNVDIFNLLGFNPHINYSPEQVHHQIQRLSLLLHTDHLTNTRWTPPADVNIININALREVLFNSNQFNTTIWQIIMENGRSGWTSTWDPNCIVSEHLNPIPSFIENPPAALWGSSINPTNIDNFGDVSEMKYVKLSSNEEMPNFKYGPYVSDLDPDYEESTLSSNESLEGDTADVADGTANSPIQINDDGNDDEVVFLQHTHILD